MRTAILASVVLAGCGVGVPDQVAEDDFSHYAAEVDCARTEECARSLYELSYYGRGDCVATEEIVWKTLIDQLKDCDYDETRAANRLQEVEEMACDDWYEGQATDTYAEVWQDCPLF